MRLQYLFFWTILSVLLVGWNGANARFGGADEEAEEDHVDNTRFLDDQDGDVDGDGSDYYYYDDGDTDGDYDYYGSDGDEDGTEDYNYYGDNDGTEEPGGDAGGAGPTPSPTVDIGGGPTVSGGGGGDFGPTPAPVDTGAGGLPTPSPVGGNATGIVPTPSPTIDNGGGPTAGGGDFGPTPSPVDNAGGLPTPSPVEPAFPTSPTSAPIYPTWPTLPPVTPTQAPAVPYHAEDDDPLQGETDDEIKNNWQWENETLEEMEHDRNVLIALSVTGAVGLCLALISAQQIIENPDGCCASICRLFVACIFGVFRCVCWPCRWVCGCTGRDRRNHDLIMAGDSNYTHDLELS